MNLLFEFELEGDITAFSLLSDTRVPIPLCNENATLNLPGDGSINGFVKEVGENVGQSALEVVLRQLDLEVNKHYYFGFHNELTKYLSQSNIPCYDFHAITCTKCI